MFTTVLLLVVGIAGEPSGDVSKEEVVTTEYAAAYAKFEKEQKPLVVIVTATWCGPCQTLKANLRPRFLGRKDVCYAEVDLDQQGSLARKLMVGDSIPQTMVYYYDKKDTRCKRFIGGGNEKVIERFVNRLFR